MKGHVYARGRNAQTIAKVWPQITHLRIIHPLQGFNQAAFCEVIDGDGFWTQVAGFACLPPA